MKKKIFLAICLLLAACAQDPYRLKIRNDMGADHGKSIYFRSNMRSNYAIEIRRALSQKFAEMGMKTATAAENADLIAIFDIETFYKQDEAYKNTSYVNTSDDAVLFTDEEDAHSLDFSGNANMQVNQDKTCFTMSIGPKGTSYVKYHSTFCAAGIMDAEQMLPLVLNVYEQYATYQYTDVGIQCFADENGQNTRCQPMHDRQQAFMNSLWIDRNISDE